MFKKNSDFLNDKITSIAQDKMEIATFDDVNSFTSAQVVLLAKAIRTTQTLKVLNLAMVSLELEQLKQLGDAILANDSIKTLILPICEADSAELKTFLLKVHQHVSTHVDSKTQCFSPN